MRATCDRTGVETVQTTATTCTWEARQHYTTPAQLMRQEHNTGQAVDKLTQLCATHETRRRENGASTAGNTDRQFTRHNASAACETRCARQKLYIRQRQRHARVKNCANGRSSARHCLDNAQWRQNNARVNNSAHDNCNDMHVEVQH